MRKRLPCRWPGRSLLVCRLTRSTVMPSPSSCGKVRLGRGGHGNHLPGDGMAILQPRGADLADGNVETPGDLPA